MCGTLATASDLPICNNFVPQKVFVSKIFDYVIAYDLWFVSPQLKIPATPVFVFVSFRVLIGKAGIVLI